MGCSSLNLMKNTCMLNLVVLLVFLTDSCNAWSFLLRKEHVHIKNKLGVGVDLKYHCRSGDDDLGERYLAYEESWELVFRPNFWGTTQFYCEFSWNNIVEWFDIYIYHRDYNRCPNHTCSWEINKSGPCRIDSDYKSTICYNWNPAQKRYAGGDEEAQWVDHEGIYPGELYN